MKVKTLRDLFLLELRDIFSAEKQLLKALPKIAKSASHEELREAFEEHTEQTENHVERLNEIFELLSATSRGEKCAAMEGLVEEAAKLLDEEMPDNVLDAALIAAAQRVEHYEIAAYGTARTFAEILGEDEAAELLNQTLEEEKETDQKLTELAVSIINPDAEGDEEEEEE